MHSGNHTGRPPGFPQHALDEPPDRTGIIDSPSGAVVAPARLEAAMTVKNILVPTDFSAGSQEAVRYAFDLASSLGASLHIMHVLENPFAPGAFMEMYAPPPPAYFDDIERQAEERLRSSLTQEQQARVRIELSTRLGNPAAEILDRLEDEPKIDLVVMATHGRGGVARLLMGSVTEKIIRSAPCPVLTLREHPHDVQPVRENALAGSTVPA
jgi:nucleotide-binding universal stress UspA family protein